MAAKMFPTQAYSLKRWTRLEKKVYMYMPNQHMALDTPALRIFGPRY